VSDVLALHRHVGSGGRRNLRLWLSGLILKEENIVRLQVLHDFLSVFAGHGGDFFMLGQWSPLLLLMVLLLMRQLLLVPLLL
jgi:hypothetical protein